MATTNMPRRHRVRPSRQARSRAATPVAGEALEADSRGLRYAMEYMDINSIQPYALNPRDNTAAIESVANSMRLVGFIMPVVIDSEDVLVAGHTRVEAAKTLGLSEIPAIRAAQLTEDQINAFRLIDNKVSELAKWDFDLLAGEISSLSDTGISLTDFGWSREELDCLTDVVREDCLAADSLVDAETQEQMRRAERRAPNTARFVLGELVFFIPAANYRTWIDDLRTEHDYNEQRMVADVKQRLGITEN